MVATLLPLGEHRLRLGDLEGAGEHFNEALAIRRRLGAVDHPETAMALVGLARVQRAKGDFAGAEPLLREALRMQEQKLGSGRPAVVATAGELSLVVDQRSDSYP